MSKKQLLTESEIRRFMKLANLEPLTKNVLQEMHEAPPADTVRRPETGLQEEDAMELGDDTGAAMDDEASEGGDESELMNLMNALKAVLKPELADKLDVESGGGEEDMGDVEMDMGGEEEGEEEAEEEGEEEGEEEEGMMAEEKKESAAEKKGEKKETAASKQKTAASAAESAAPKKESLELSEDALVEAVLARVTARLVAEAKKKKKSAKEKMKEKKAKKEVVEEALDGVNLAEKGKEQKNVWKGHADMEMGKGEKGGKGGHELEMVTAKSDHTVTHGGKNLATLGGNKK